MRYNFYDGHIYNNISLWTDEFIKEHKHEINWPKLIKKVPLSEELIEELEEFFDWKDIFLYQPVSEQFIEKHIDKLKNWDWLYAHRTLSIEFATKYKNKINWRVLSQNPNLTKNFIEEFADSIDWQMFTIHNLEKIDDIFAREFFDYIDWNEYIQRKPLSNDLRRELVFNHNKKKSQLVKHTYLVWIGRMLKDKDWDEWHNNYDKKTNLLESALRYNYLLTENVIIPNAYFFSATDVKLSRVYNCSRKIKNFIEKYPNAFHHKFER